MVKSCLKSYMYRLAFASNYYDIYLCGSGSTELLKTDPIPIHGSGCTTLRKSRDTLHFISVPGDAGPGHVPAVGHEEHHPADPGPQQDQRPAPRSCHPGEPGDTQPVQQQPGGGTRLPLRHAQAQVNRIIVLLNRNFECYRLAWAVDSD